MSEPKRIQPTYFGPNDESESFTKGLKSFWKDQIVAPQYYDDNLKIARAIGLFALGITLVRSNLGSILVPMF